jgi:N6-L-threonylcarbamoyladenine synthase
VSAYCFDFIGDTLAKLSENLREKYENIPIIYAGGVMSNGRIKKMLASFDNVYFSAPEFSSDNAAGVALLGRRKYLSEND